MLYSKMFCDWATGRKVGFLLCLGCSCQTTPFRRRDRCYCPESRGHIELPAACGNRVRQGRGKDKADKGDATREVSKRSRRCLYCQTAGELFPAPEESGRNLLQCSRQLRDAQLKEQAQRVRLTVGKKDLLPKLSFESDSARELTCLFNQT